MNMKVFHCVCVATSLLIGSAAYADGFGFNLGPFSLQFGGGSGGRVVTMADIQTDPICHAIARQKHLGLIVKGREKVSDKEFKIVIKKITIEPYLFGTNNRRQPVLKGKVIDEKMIKEITIKYGEGEDIDENGSMSGTFQIEQKKGDISRLKVDQIEQIFIIEDSHFDVPKGYDKNSYNDVVNVICELATKE